MDRSAAVKHAQEIARQAVRLGLADLEATKRHYQDYLFYVNLGFEGSFTQILLARNAIQPHTGEVLERLIPFRGESPLVHMPVEERMSSMVVRLPRPVSPPAPPLAALPDGTIPEPVALPPAPAPTPPSAPTPEPKAHDTLPVDMSEVEEELARRDGRKTLALPALEEELGSGPYKPSTVDDSALDLFFPELDRSTEVVGPQFAHLDTSASSELTFAGPPLSEAATKIPETTSSDSDTRDSETRDGDCEAQPSDTSEFIWNNSAGPASGAKTKAASADAEPLMPKLGGFLGEFQLQDVLGQGGMGVVFKTQRPGDEVVYGLKVLRVREGAKAKAEKRRQRFRREVDAMQRLEHPGIVRVHGYGRDGPFDWFVMDYVKGKSLASRIDDDGWGLDDRLRCFAEICAALAHAHSRNVIHRDLKPQNVIVDEEGRPHLLDFGLAKIVDEETELTHTGSALGTPFYMSPEHVNDPTGIDARSDVFSLGVMLYELVTRARPFTGHSAGEVGNKVLTVDPPRPSRLNPDVPPNVDAICLKALEKSAMRRYPSVTALRADLLAHVDGASLPRETVLHDARRWYDRNRSGMQMGLLIASVFFTLLAILAGLYYLLST